MALQVTDWGEIEWLQEQQEIFSEKGLKTGIVTLSAGAHQPKHRHYEEQVIYVMEGEALSILDGVKSHLTAGTFAHWKAGVEHEIFNIGSGNFRHLMVANPDTEMPEEENFREGDQQKEASPDLIYTAVEAIRTQFLDTIHYGYAIFDSFGNLIVQSRFFPEFCTECCKPEEAQGKCECMHRFPLNECGEEHIFSCENGMEVFQYPILYGKTFMGYIQSGYIRHSSSKKGKIESVYDAPESVVAGIKALVRRIVKAIRNYCEFEQFRRELMERELHITTQEESQRILMKNLKDTQTAMTDLKINNHFLFNTLNSMASMALDEGSMALYQSIVDLSKMFRYTLRTQASMVPLEKEIEYVKAYLQLQKLRYSEELDVSWSVDEETRKVSVPFNFLQPVVENAFIHGFEESVHKKIRITVEKVEDQVEICVLNTGKKLSDQACKVINQGIQGNTSHGLSMLYQKLNTVYGENFAFEIETDRRNHTVFLIRIPVEHQAEGGRI